MAAGARRRLGPVRLALALLAVALLVNACRAGPGADHYATVLDGLGVPETWELVHTTVRSQGGPDKAVDPSRDADNIDCFMGECPSVTRYYLVDGLPPDVFVTGQDLLTSAGFTIERKTSSACDVPPSGPACSMTGTNGQDYVRINLFKPGTTTGDGFGSSEPSRTLVELVARYAD